MRLCRVSLWSFVACSTIAVKQAEPPQVVCSFMLPGVFSFSVTSLPPCISLLKKQSCSAEFSVRWGRAVNLLGEAINSDRRRWLQSQSVYSDPSISNPTPLHSQLLVALACQRLSTSLSAVKMFHESRLSHAPQHSVTQSQGVL
ncbi:hypothetical protein BDZ45DRAFT_48716 [Acephala macrosclerotiorum]|nr:hypothetical protein BDZ45DRAFT_48716 [Acephala macrosclerotiorum]